MEANRKVLVKNRAPAPVQITAEQILREANDRIEKSEKGPRTTITDAEELMQYRVTKRKEFEDAIRRQRQHIGNYVKYAKWEESQHEFERARSVFQRALDMDYKNHSLWLQYAEMEMRNKFVNHARNVWDRAVQLLPRIDQFWYKYSYMEEMVGNIANARTIFERWMEWEPDDNGWSSYVKFEMRQSEPERARKVFERYIHCHPTQRAYLKFARWEERQMLQPARARELYERAMNELADAEKDEKLYIAFAHFEERQKEFDRARVIYKYALDTMPRDQVLELYNEFITFEKKHGNRQGIEEVIVSKRRTQYEEKLSADPLDYDTWFDYVRLEEAEGDLDKIRDVYERAIAQVPPVAEKRFWRRYIYLWINYALFEELQAADVERTRQVYKACLGVIPHQEFSFAKIWIMFAHFEVRNKDLDAARKILGQAIGRSGKEKVFKAYISLELQLGEIERCRKLYAKYLEMMPHNCEAWNNFADMEKTVGETERARAIFELAIAQPALDMPETLWKAYIDFEIGEAETDNVRQLYERLLERTSHVKVWISFGQFEAENGGGIEEARTIFQRAYDYLKKQELKEERVLLLDAWRNVEKEKGDKNGLAQVETKMPKKLKKRRMMMGEGGEELGWEEYYDYSFPDDTAAPQGLKILEAAQKWKETQRLAALKRKREEEGEEGEENGE